MQETITAIATPSGTGGIAVIRVSGPQSIEIVDKIFVPVRKERKLSTTPSQQTIYGHFGNIDEVMVTAYRAPHSFTGEECVEISCHGSLYIQKEIVKTLIDKGCQMAEPGEFTKRAFLSGRIDLTQAEAIADLIGAKSEAAHRLALKQLNGAISERLAMLRDKLVKLASLIELELDFSDHEDVEFVDRSELMALGTEIKSEIERLCRSFDQGSAVKNGIPVAIVGEPNAGKSTLLNRLIEDDCAIVSDIAGTTRDTIERETIINGVLFRFIDTAGLHETEDTIERLGIERTMKAVEKAMVIIELSTPSSANSLNLSDKLHAGQHLIKCMNKSDLLTSGTGGTDTLYISALKETNIDQLRQKLYEISVSEEIEDVTITNSRHYEALMLAKEDIGRVLEGLEAMMPTDLVAQDLRECTFHLAEITGGEITANELLSNIFSHFCIGK